MSTIANAISITMKFPPFAELICVWFAALSECVPAPGLHGGVGLPLVRSYRGGTSPGMVSLSDGHSAVGKREDFPLSVHKVLVLCSRSLTFTKSLQTDRPLCCIWVKSHIHPLQHTSLFPFLTESFSFILSEFVVYTDFYGVSSRSPLTVTAISFSSTGTVARKRM